MTVPDDLHEEHNLPGSSDPWQAAYERQKAAQTPRPKADLITGLVITVLVVLGVNLLLTVYLVAFVAHLNHVLTP